MEGVHACATRFVRGIGANSWAARYGGGQVGVGYPWHLAIDKRVIGRLFGDLRLCELAIRCVIVGHQSRDESINLALTRSPNSYQITSLQFLKCPDLIPRHRREPKLLELPLHLENDRVLPFDETPCTRRQHAKHGSNQSSGQD